jgi:hypothetical protein
MRSLLVFGITAAFIACAFVPPSQQNFIARAEQAKVQVAERTKAALGTAGLPSSADLKRAAALMKSLSKDPNVTTLLEKAEKGVRVADQIAILQKAADALKTVSPSPKKIVSRVVHKAVVSVTGVQPSARWKEIVETEKNSDLRLQLERVDFAARKGDVRLCKEISNAEFANHAGFPATGDLLALCLAKITGESSRCDQINSNLFVPLKPVCTEELAANV